MLLSINRLFADIPVVTLRSLILSRWIHASSLGVRDLVPILPLHSLRRWLPQSAKSNQTWAGIDVLGSPGRGLRGVIEDQIEVMRRPKSNTPHGTEYRPYSIPSEPSRTMGSSLHLPGNSSARCQSSCQLDRHRRPTLWSANPCKAAMEYGVRTLSRESRPSGILFHDRGIS